MIEFRCSCSSYLHAGESECSCDFTCVSIHDIIYDAVLSHRHLIPDHGILLVGRTGGDNYFVVSVNNLVISHIQICSILELNHSVSLTVRNVNREIHIPELRREQTFTLAGTFCTPGGVSPLAAIVREEQKTEHK